MKILSALAACVVITCSSARAADPPDLQGDTANGNARS